MPAREGRPTPGGDHIYGVLSDDQSMADSVIERTAQWFAETL